MTKEAFYFNGLNNSDLELNNAEINHIFNSKRYGVGDEIILLSGDGNKVNVKITSDRPPSFEIISKEYKEKNSPEIDVAISSLKGNSLDLAVENATLIGANKIIIWESERSIAKLKSKEKKEIEKLKLKSIEFSKVARRAWFPEIHGEIMTSKNLSTLFKNYDCIYVCHENADNSLSIHKNEVAKMKKVLLIFGPEGGLSDSEVEKFANLGAKLVLLGENILKAPTAILASLSVLML